MDWGSPFIFAQAERQRQATRPGLAVRGTFSPARALASCRRRPLSSNVSHHRTARAHNRCAVSHFKLEPALPLSGCRLTSNTHRQSWCLDTGYGLGKSLLIRSTGHFAAVQVWAKKILAQTRPTAKCRLAQTLGLTRTVRGTPPSQTADTSIPRIAGSPDIP